MPEQPRSNPEPVRDSKARSVGSVARWIAAGLLSLSMLLWVAIANGFPLLFSDSSAYIAIGARFAVTFERPMTYGVALAPFLHMFGLWGVVIAQAALSLWIIKRVLDVVLGGCTPADLLISAAALAGMSSLPWYAGQIMADLFTGLVALTGFLLIFGWRHLHRTERWLLPLLLTGMIAFHLSFIPLMAALILVGAITTWWLGRWRAARGGLVAVSGALVLAFTLLSTVNWIADRHFKPSLMSDSFLLARLLEAGLAQRPLEELCREQPMGLCALLPLIAPGADLGKFKGSPGYFYLFAQRSPIRRLNYTNWQKIRDEESLVVSRAIGTYPTELFELAMTGWGRQLVTARTADGSMPCEECARVIRSDLPGDLPSFLGSRQEHDSLKNLSVVPVAGIALIAALAMPGLLWWAIRRRADDLFALGLMVGAAVVANAAVCGMLTGVFDRLQSRIIWLLPFFVVAVGLSRFRQNEAGPG